MGKLQINKSVNTELKQATFIALVPDEVDLHGDIYDEEEVRKACHNFNKFCRKANLLHLVDTNGFTIAESYILPSDITLDEKPIKKGTWVTVLQFEDEDLWEGVKSGQFNGVSIGAIATVETIQGE